MIVFKSCNAEVSITDHGSWYELAVRKVEGDPIEIPLAVGRLPGKCWVLPLDHRVRIYGGLGHDTFAATAMRREGEPSLVGARVAVVPEQEEEEMHQSLVDARLAGELPVVYSAGPSSLLWGSSREPYFYSHPDTPSRENVWDWISLCNRTGIRAINWVHSFRYGDYQPKLPGGDEEVREVVEILQAHRIASLLHTYGPAIHQDAEVPWPEETTETPHGYRVPTSERLLLWIADQIVRTALIGGFKAVYFDAIDWCQHCESKEWAWWWQRRLISEVLSALPRGTIVETSQSGANVWPMVSRGPSLDHLPQYKWREYVDKFQPLHRLRPTVGWLDAERAESEADIVYALNHAKKIEAAMVWRNITPTKYRESEKIRRYARLIGSQG